MIRNDESLRGRRTGDEARMLHPLLRTLVKVAVASLIVGTILAHFGVTADQLVKEFGLTTERIQDLARQGVAWALPNVLLGALVIVPVWFLVYLFRPPRGRGNQQPD
jgi:H+/Cl- antiporter ClcA